MFGQLILEGLAIGACYAVFGIAVVIIYKTSEVINFAQGEMAMLSTFVAYHILTVYGWPFWSAFLLTMLFSVLLGVFIEFAFLRPAKDPSLLGLIVITLGAEMLLMGLAGWKWGAEQKEFSLPFSFQKTHELIPGVVINDWAVAVFVTASCLMVFLFLFFRLQDNSVFSSAISKYSKSNILDLLKVFFTNFETSLADFVPKYSFALINVL